MSTDAGVRLRDLERRRGFDANILPRKRPALSDAERQAKVKEIDRQCIMMVILTTQELWSELFMLARSVVYRSAIKRRKESDLLALLARWSAKLGYEFHCLSFVRKLIIRAQ